MRIRIARIRITSSSLLAAFMAASPVALAQDSPVCLKSTSGMANCVYQTIAQCEAAKGINVAAQCISRSDIVTSGRGMPSAATTGQGSGQSTPRHGPLPPR
jgi:hypothetical protein